MVTYCKDCGHFHPADTELWMDCNKPKKDFCWRQTEYDFVYNHADFFYVKPTDYCAWPEEKLDKK